jgi:hypothetical protein
MSRDRIGTAIAIVLTQARAQDNSAGKGTPATYSVDDTAAGKVNVAFTETNVA